MMTNLRRDWMEQLCDKPTRPYLYIWDVLGLDDPDVRIGEDGALWAEVPPPVRDAILAIAVIECNTNKLPSIETFCNVAAEHNVRAETMMLAFGWFPPPHARLTETDKTVLRAMAVIDRPDRTLN